VKLLSVKILKLFSKMSIALNKIKDMHKRVESLLKRFPAYRDCDTKLVAHIWMEQVGGIERMKEINLHDWMKMCIDNPNIAVPETICRARRKIQKTNEALRGEHYKLRKEQEKDVRENINKI
jgi:hypothetical protein